MGHATWWPLLKLLSLYPIILAKSLQLIWSIGIRRFNLRVPDLLTSYSDLTKWVSASLVVPVMATRATCPIIETGMARITLTVCCLSMDHESCNIWSSRRQIHRPGGACFNIKTIFPGIAIPIMVVRQSHLDNGNPYTGTTSLTHGGLQQPRPSLVQIMVCRLIGAIIWTNAV